MAATFGAGPATLLMSDGPLQQGTTQNLGGRADRVSQLVAPADGFLLFHLHRRKHISPKHSRGKM
jgi:hypothetical protein